MLNLRIASVECTDLFVGSTDGSAGEPRQVVRVRVKGARSGRDVTVTVRGGAEGSLTAPAGREALEVPVRCTEPPGTEVPVEVEAVVGRRRATARATMTVAEPGWTMYMVSHFHYDPVWWNTQAGYTVAWNDQKHAQKHRSGFQHAGFDLVHAHLELARRDPDYCFVLAELDYLKPYWDAFPQDRDALRRLLAEGRLELMGGLYNEPNTNLTGAETTIRNAVHGLGFQQDVIGGDPATAWQLDVFGHDPQFPGLMAAAGLTSSSWARGPFHQWGPNMTPHGSRPKDADTEGMQFASEFDWVAPSGESLLTHYMAGHYSAGWKLDSCGSLREAEEAALRLFRILSKAAATKNVLLPVGTDYTPPNRWATAIHRDWNARYVWPRIVCGLPRDFFAAVRAELASSGRRLTPQTRDMNPIYTGKDVSYIDTKLAQRATENLLLDAEKFATLACLLGDAAYPEAALDKAWRHLVYGAHHDGITGSESDQVYLDLLAGWREAWDLASTVHCNALTHLTARIDTASLAAAEPDAAGRVLTVFNPSSWARTDLVRFTAPPSFGGLVDAEGRAVPTLREPGGEGPDTVTFLAQDVPSLGHRSYRVAANGSTAAAPEGWRAREGTSIANEFHDLTVAPARGGGVSSLRERATGRELIASGAVGNELLVYDEYPAHPDFHEGPWHLLPTGRYDGAAAHPAESVVVEQCPLGERVTVRGRVGPADYTQRLTLWRGLDRVDCETRLDDWTGSDQLVRLRWPCPVPGALPVSEVADAVIGRGFAHPDVDVAVHPWTLDNPAHQWFGLSSAARVVLTGTDGAAIGARALGVAEIVAPDEAGAAGLGRELSVALVRAGVTATCSVADGHRYGVPALDSNLPDVRISVGGPEVNSFTAAVLDAAGPAHADELKRQLAADGHALVWVPARKPLAHTWLPGADLTAPLDLPVLVLAGASGGDGVELEAAVARVVADLRDARIEVRQAAKLCGEADLQFEDRTVALLNRGMPGFAVDVRGRLHVSLLRSCTGWPSGVWIDPPKRTVPDGSGFQLQHWTHTFAYALASGAGDWRETGMVARAHDFNHPLTAVLTDRHAAGPSETPGASGMLPPTGSLVSVEPAGQVVLTALKATGNPLATGRSGGADPVGSGFTARFYEAHGHDAEARLTVPVPLASAAHADLVERPGAAIGVGPDGTVTTTVGPNGVQTVLLSPATRGSEATTALASRHEAAQPVFTRYWLHNRGPAPLGNLPVGVHLTAAPDAATTALRVTVASDLVDRAAEVALRLVAPEGWQIDPSDRPLWLPPGDWTEVEATLTPPAPPAKAGAGPHLVRAQLEHEGRTYEDVLFVDGSGRPTSVDNGTLTVELDAKLLTLRPGGSATLTATLRNGAPFEIQGECQAVSPWGTWSAVTPATQGFTVPAHGSAQVRVDVAAPGSAAGDDGGHWWVLLKTMWFGRIGYSPAVRLVVGEQP
ncbi:glycoside hydrolase family 38 C-terminal domain-containing protein [Streptacidiphilus sp. BW17]|uniref:glycoside hydrolase family 38 N-terminal domain-containing protein n=1 Tax=Streptacidiphilus sp. BW17 TaxID=3156274 RepID=UPI0035191B49